MTSAYVKRLNAFAAIETLKHLEDKELAAAQAAQAARDRLSPLDQRLARLLNSLPDELLREGVSLRSLQVSLRGRWRGNVHPGELGRELRRWRDLNAVGS